MDDLIARVWDIALTPGVPSGRSSEATYLRLSIPVAISRTLRERGCNRVKLEVTDDGILLRPYAGPITNGGTEDNVELPEWGSA